MPYVEGGVEINTGIVFKMATSGWAGRHVLAELGAGPEYLTTSSSVGLRGGLPMSRASPSSGSYNRSTPSCCVASTGRRRPEATTAIQRSSCRPEAPKSMDRRRRRKAGNLQTRITQITTASKKQTLLASPMVQIELVGLAEANRRRFRSSSSSRSTTGGEGQLVDMGSGTCRWRSTCSC